MIIILGHLCPTLKRRLCLKTHSIKKVLFFWKHQNEEKITLRDFYTKDKIYLLSNLYFKNEKKKLTNDLFYLFGNK